MPTYKTNAFKSEVHAMQYYRARGCSTLDVRRRINSGEIAIGKPYVFNGEQVHANVDGRYYLEW